MVVEEGAISQYNYSDGNVDLNCVNSILLNEELQNMLQEFKSARSIIAVLQEDMNNLRKSEGTRQPTSVQCGEPKLCESTSRKRISVVSNRNKKPKNCLRHLAK